MLFHAVFQRGQLLFVDEHRQLAGFGEIDHGDEIGGALEAIVFFHRHVSERGGQQGSAEAVADDIDLTLAGRLLDRVERGQGPFEHVILELLLRELLVGIDP